MVGAAAMGLVVSDDEAGLGGGRLISGSGRRGSRFHKMPTCQGRSKPLLTGVKLCMETSAGTSPARRRLSITPVMASW
jgi:hypothetical protein